MMRDKIAAIIREVDGNHTMGAGELGENIAEAKPDMIEPLVWWVSSTGDFVCDTDLGRYQIQACGARWCCMCAMGIKSRRGSVDPPSFHRCTAAAKAAANIHHRAAIMAAFGVSL